jgi:hypothetical protein
VQYSSEIALSIVSAFLVLQFQKKNQKKKSELKDVDGKKMRMNGKFVFLSFFIYLFFDVLLD